MVEPMTTLDLTNLELKMLWLVTDIGLDVGFGGFDQEERQAALTAFEKVYHAYRITQRAA